MDEAALHALMSAMSVEELEALGTGDLLDLVEGSPVHMGAAMSTPTGAPGGPPANITVRFADVGLTEVTTATVVDVWTGAALGSFEGSYAAAHVAFHDTAFVILTPSLQSSPGP